jgi:hypothetical protein
VITQLGYVLFSIGLLLSWANSAAHVLFSDRPLYMHSRRVFEGGVRGPRALALSLPTLGYIALVVLFYRRIQPEIVAVALLASMAAIRRFEVMQWEGDVVVRLGKYVPAAASLLAWLIADGVLQACGYDVEEARALAWNASCGVMAGAYVLAGIAKLRESGVQWVHPRYQSLLIAERGYSGPRWVRSFRVAIARSRTASWVVGVSGLGIEFAAIALVVPVLRWPATAAVLLVNAGFALLLGYVEVEWVAVIVAVVALAS